MNNADSIKVKAKELLSQAGFTPSITLLEPCTRGGNNRTFRLETTNQTFAFKEYFRQEGDKRDRLTSEYAFLSYANLAAPGMTPKAYAKDDEAGIALYEFIDGNTMQPGEVTHKDVIQAADFFQALNQYCHPGDVSSHPGDVSHHSGDVSRYPGDVSHHFGDVSRHSREGGNPSLINHHNLPTASEACFSIQAHLDLVDARVKRLTEMSVEDTQDQDAKLFIDDLHHHWERVKQRVLDGVEKCHLQIDEELAQHNRCLSPSDFGFHNALKCADGRLVFLDFEYAGWDDPAKMTGDFFSQLAVPVPAEYFEEFTNIVMQPFADTDMLVARAKLLRKVYEIKWCCIALNVFIPVNLARRKFANPDLNVIDLKQSQIAKAKSLIQRMETVNYG